MSSAHLYHVLKALQEVTKGIVEDEHLEAVENTIQTCAIIAAATGVGAGMFPGGALVLTAASVAAVWGMYIKINKVLGISISENALKSLASALLTNMIAAIGAYVVALVATFLIALIPGLHFLAAPAEALIAYMMVFASGILYIKFLTNVFKAKGSFNFSEADVENSAKEVVNNTDMKSVIDDVRQSYKDDKDKIAKERKERNGK